MGTVRCKGKRPLFVTLFLSRYLRLIMKWGMDGHKGAGEIRQLKDPEEPSDGKGHFLQAAEEEKTDKQAAVPCNRRRKGFWSGGQTL